MQKEEAGVRGGRQAKSYSEAGGTKGPPQVSHWSNKQDATHLYSIWHPLPPSKVFERQTEFSMWLEGIRSESGQSMSKT